MARRWASRARASGVKPQPLASKWATARRLPGARWRRHRDSDRIALARSVEGDQDERTDVPYDISFAERVVANSGTAARTVEGPAPRWHSPRCVRRCRSGRSAWEPAHRNSPRRKFHRQPTCSAYRFIISTRPRSIVRRACTWLLAAVTASVRSPVHHHLPVGADADATGIGERHGSGLGGTPGQPCPASDGGHRHRAGFGTNGIHNRIQRRSAWPCTGSVATRKREVLGPEVQNCLGVFAVAACSAELLVVLVGRPRDVDVEDPADVRLVDTHPEGNCGDDHVRVTLVEAALHDASVRRPADRRGN